MNQPFGTCGHVPDTAQETLNGIALCGPTGYCPSGFGTPPRSGSGNLSRGRRRDGNRRRPSRAGGTAFRDPRARLAVVQDPRSPQLRLGPAPGHGIRVARCSQLSVRRDHSPRLLGAALMGIGTSEARGWGRKAGSRRCSTTFRPQAIRSSLRGHLNCWHRAVPETCSAAVRSDLPARRRPTAGKE
jgi:hypothetical protein